MLTALGFAGDFGGESWAAAPPPWRNDVGGEACLVEEVIRLLAYDRIPVVPLPRPSSLPKPALAHAAAARPRPRGLAARGLTEAVTYSFVSSKAAEPFDGAPECLRLVNPISADLDVMRPSLLPNLILAAQRNARAAFATRRCSRSAHSTAATGRKSRRSSRRRFAPAAPPTGTGRNRRVPSMCSMPKRTPSVCWKRRGFVPRN